MKKKFLTFLILSFSLNSCATTTVQPSSSGIPGDLQEQLDRTTNSNTTSAKNALTQSKVIYGELVGRWNSVSPIDIGAFDDTKNKLLPPMFIIAQSLTSDNTASDDKKSITDDFKQLYFDSLTNMLRGINNNLQIYQNFLENSNILPNSDKDSKSGDTEEVISTLTNIFKATEITELFVAQLGAFPNLSPGDETQKLLNGVKNQQTTILNGIINYTSNNRITTEQAKKSYLIIVQSLVNPNLLNSLANLAISVFGKDNVAFKQDARTSTQPNPNLTVMVIREDSSVYRMISIESGRVSNRTSNDNRGLSASDMLNNSNVNIVKVQK